MNKARWGWLEMYHARICMKLEPKLPWKHTYSWVGCAKHGGFHLFGFWPRPGTLSKDRDSAWCQGRDTKANEGSNFLLARAQKKNFHKHIPVQLSHIVTTEICNFPESWGPGTSSQHSARGFGTPLSQFRFASGGRGAQCASVRYDLSLARFTLGQRAVWAVWAG